MIDKKFFMLCKSTAKEGSEIFFNSGYKANIKYDGERIIGIKKGKDVFLLNRRCREKSFIYPEIARDLSTLDFDFIFDGEVITLDGKFNSLQFRSNLSDREKIRKSVIENPVKFMVFDIINFKGQDLRFRPLWDRIKYFSKINLTGLKVEFVSYEDVEECLNYAEQEELEGIVIKDMNGTYEHRRSNFWLKLKLFKEEKHKFIRFTENPKGIRVEDEELNAIQVAGKNGVIVKKELQEKGFCWIVVQYLEKTKNGRLRFPSFKELEKEI